MLIVSIDYSPENEAFTGISFDGTHAQQFIVTQQYEQIDKVNMVFTDYDHLWNVWGKFDPYRRFLADPIEVEEITYREIKAKVPDDQIG